MRNKNSERFCCVDEGVKTKRDIISMHHSSSELCAKSFPEEVTEDMNLVIKLATKS